MLKIDAVKFFGNKTKLAKAAGVKPSSVSVWGDLVPEGRASRLVEASGGALIYDSAVYDAHRKARLSGEVNQKTASHRYQSTPTKP